MERQTDLNCVQAFRQKAATSGKLARVNFKHFNAGMTKMIKRGVGVRVSGYSSFSVQFLHFLPRSCILNLKLFPSCLFSPTSIFPMRQIKV